ncbi:MAG: AbgT family transporter, partial [Pirellulaceae bacterium]|nr:AbgT family transporter [Pirellulaceae bacterium]
MESLNQRGGILNWVEKVGNRLPDPVTLFVIGAAAVLLGSDLAVRFGWTVTHPVDGSEQVAISLLSKDGLQWVWLNLVKNFTGFA